MPSIESADRTLIQIVDAALEQAARLSGAWLACRPGCTQCCVGPFPITQLDAWRLRQGLGELETADPSRAGRVRERASAWVRRYARDSAVSRELFEAWADEEPCPALDPRNGTCDLYAWRPMTCRTFGPPVRFGEQALAVCELCFQGAGEDEIAACEVEFDPDGLEGAILEDMSAEGETMVAWALAAEVAQPLAAAVPAEPHCPGPPGVLR